MSWFLSHNAMMAWQTCGLCLVVAVSLYLVVTWLIGRALH